MSLSSLILTLFMPPDTLDCKCSMRLWLVAVKPKVISTSQAGAGYGKNVKSFWKLFYL